MNILFLANHLNIGGITSYLLTLGTGLSAAGHQVWVASSGGDAQERFVAQGINVVFIPIRTKSEASPKVLLSTIKLVPLIKKSSIDIIHSNTRVTQVLASIVSRYTVKPHVTTFHGFFKPKLSRRISPCLGERVIAISQPVREHLLRDLKVDAKKIVLIHNGIDVERFRSFAAQSAADARNRLGIQKKPVVGIVARLSDVKGHTYLIQAMRLVVRQFPQALLLIAGEGKEKESLLQQVASLGMAEHVQFMGNTDDTRQVLCALDVFVMPSLHEGLGLGLMEAMASGVPVVGSDVGGIKSLIIDKENGLLVAPEDVQGFATAIISLLRDTALRRKLAARGQAFMAEHFSCRQMVQATEKVYAQCLSLSA